jgi:predicted nuclease of predicted toxin-antitoxin system
MIKFLADENFDRDIIRGLLLKQATLDIVRAQDVGLSGEDDPTILAWAAQEERILLTHDVKTITKFAYQRLVANQPMPGVLEIRFSLNIGQVIEDILLIVECSPKEEWEGRVVYLPL